jgi:integrase
MIYKRGNLWHMDVTVNGVRYREALDSTDRREASSLEKKRVAEIQAGKGASKTGREFARKPFSEAVVLFQEERKPHVAPRTMQFEKERLKPLSKYFGEKPLMRFKAEDISSYQRERLKSVAPRTVNMEVSLLRRMLKRAKVWSVVAEDVRMFPERSRPVARVLTAEQKRALFEAASSRPDWLVAYCAAVLAVSTTCRGVELKNLHWRDVDLFNRVMTINRSKTEAGHRDIPLNGDAGAALARLLERARVFKVDEPDHFVFPACEHDHIDATRPQKSWRTSWRKLLAEAARTSGRQAASKALASGGRIGLAKLAWRNVAAPFKGFRFHDLRHQAITELAEAGATDATMLAVAGHMSRRMLEHYSHVRMAAKRDALQKLEGGLMNRAQPQKLAKDGQSPFQ